MRSFNEISQYNFENDRQGDIVKEIQSKGKDYILKVDEQEYINYLYDKYLLTPLTVDKDSETFDTPRIAKERINAEAYGRYYDDVDTYTFKIKYKYTGSDELFRDHSNT